MALLRLALDGEQEKGIFRTARILRQVLQSDGIHQLTWVSLWHGNCETGVEARFVATQLTFFELGHVLLQAAPPPRSSGTSRNKLTSRPSRVALGKC